MRRAPHCARGGTHRRADPSAPLSARSSAGYAEAREELLWEIELAGREWEHAGVHPHRGAIALAAWVREIREQG